MEYSVLYLHALNKIVVYRNSDIIFEGSPKEIDKAKEALLSAYNKDLMLLELEKDVSYSKLEDLDAELNSNSGSEEESM